MSLSSVSKERLNKIEELKKTGQPVYPSKTDRSLDIGQIIEKQAEYLNNKTALIAAGRVMAQRKMGKLVFMQIVDSTGKLQLLAKKESLGDKFKELKLLDIGDFIEATGSLMKTKTGELTIEVQDWKVLSKSIRPLPEKFHGLKDQEERYRRRYIDLLVNPQVRDVFAKRSLFINNLRNYLCSQGFLEVETPILQPIAGGAIAEPFVTHHSALDIDLYLRIATELYLKRLIVGGLDKVFEIGPDFRNEGISTQHLQEFTQCEFYKAYANYEDLMVFTEELFSDVLQKTFDTLVFEYGDMKLDFTPPWPRLEYGELILDKTGIDIFSLKSDVKKLRKLIKKNKLDVEDKPAYGFGKLVDNIYKHYVRSTVIQPSFLMHHHIDLLPLAKKKEDDPNKAESFQLLAAGGFEIVKAYSELNDPQDQKQRFEEQSILKNDDPEAHAFDKDFIEALEYGMPPTGGWGMGIDRIMMILTNQPSVRDVVLFPTLKPPDKNK
ncbi:lysine--tRNA ligase [Patescibacteria group bacterium]